MSKFLRKSMWYVLVALLYLICAFRIDPYNIFRQEQDAEWAEMKGEIAYKLNYPLYKIPQYQYAKTPIVLLGDSRTQAIKEQYIVSEAGRKASNLAYGGGSLSEILETFKSIQEDESLEHLIIGINFNLYNALNNNNRVKEALQLIDHPQQYLLSKYTLEAILLMGKSHVLSLPVALEKPPLDRKAFWKYQLGKNAKSFYGTYSYPQAYFDQLKALKAHCQKHDIRLTFFIPPTHVSLQEKIEHFGLEEEHRKFIWDLSSVSTLYDFDIRSELTIDSTLYKDPFHCIDSISEIVAKELFSSNPRFAELYEP